MSKGVLTIYGIASAAAETVTSQLVLESSRPTKTLKIISVSRVAHSLYFRRCKAVSCPHSLSEDWRFKHLWLPVYQDSFGWVLQAGCEEGFCRGVAIDLDGIILDCYG